MNITPLDIRKHEFRRVIRGFDPDEVITFLDVVSIEFENLIRENALLTEKSTNLDNQLKKYRDIESTLRETLLSAQRAREDTISAAKKQSEVIIREAEVKASSIIEEGRSVLSKLRNAFTELKIHKDSYLTKVKALTRAQLETIEQFTFSEEDTVEKIEHIIEQQADTPDTKDTMDTSVPKKKKPNQADQPDNTPLTRETFFPEDKS